MLGLIEKEWLLNQHLDVGKSSPNNFNDQSSEAISLYFGLGHSIVLSTDPRVFRVSLAGLIFGNYLVKAVGNINSVDRFLDLGTGSGVHALLMRQIGMKEITASDISVHSIELACQNEKINFDDQRVSFHVSDLFSQIPEKHYDLVAFNPPGWRSPSPGLSTLLERQSESSEISPRAMFYGDDVILRFLYELPKYLATGGRAIVGLNSLVGIRDVLKRYSQIYQGEPPLKFRLKKRHSLPLFYYTNHWEKIRTALLEEFQEWRNQGVAAYKIDPQGTLHWSYEIVEFFYDTKYL